MKKAINNALRRFGVELHGTGYLQALAKGDFKKDAFAMQKERLHGKCKQIFDVGANRGDVVTVYRELFPNAEIFAFEPFPDSFSILKNRYENDKQVHCNQVALAAEEGKKSFYVNHNADTNSLLEPKETGLSSDKQVKNIKKIEVDSITIDNFCLQNGIENIDILKMDIQGGELDALKGTKQMLAKGKIGLIYSEVYFLEQYVDQPLFHDISSFLHKYGYYLQDVYSPIYGKGNIAWADVIFCKK
jgi:FkbM family methyltransferase